MFSKTAIREWVVAALGLLVTLGVDLPVDQIVALFDQIWTDGAGLIAMIWAAVGLWLRKLTSSPVAGGIKGFLGFKK